MKHKQLGVFIIAIASLFIIGCGDGISGRAVGENFDEPDCNELLIMLVRMKHNEDSLRERSEDVKAYEIMHAAVMHKCMPDQLEAGDTVNN